MKRASATLGLLGVLVGVPVVLLKLGGGPTIPSFHGVRLTDTYMPLDPILEVLALIAWTLWAYVASVAVLRAVAVAVGGSGTLFSASSVLTPRPLRVWVDLAIGGALLASTINPRMGTNLDQVARSRTVATVPDAPRSHDGQAVGETRPNNISYRVRAGDSLWRIAERKLGSGFRWREIFELNRGKSFDQGQRLTDPLLIHPGWTLELPMRTSRHPSRPLPLPKPDSHRSVESVKQSGSPTVADKTDYSSHRAASRIQPLVRMPSGLVVATSFASGLVTAELLALLRRRRRFRPLFDPVEQPADPELIRELRSSGAVQAPSILDAAADALVSMWNECFNETPPLIAALERSRRVLFFLADVGAQLPSEIGGSFSPRIVFRAREGMVEAEVTGPFSPQLDGAGPPIEDEILVPAFYASDAVLHLAPFGLGLISINGPCAADIALQMLIASATRSTPDDLEVILLGAGDELRSAEALPHVARCVAWEDAGDALRDIQAEFLRRARQFFQEGVESARAYRALRPEEHLPRLLIVAGAPPNALRGVVEAAAIEAPRLGAAFVALGWKPQGTRLHAAVTDRVDLEPPLIQHAKPFSPLVLDASAARDAVGVLRNAHTREPVPDLESDTVEAPHLQPLDLASDRQTHDAETQSPTLPARPDAVPNGSKSLPPPPDENAAPCAEIRCLGPIVVARSDGTIPAKGWRAPAKELLAYLVLHPDGVHKERLADLFFPAMPTKKALDLVARAASSVRTRVRTLGDERKYVELDGETWRLERGVWRVDAWDMERLITEERPAEPERAIANLRAALALYRGEFCDDAYFDWAQASRERYRALFLRASAQLAERLSDAGEREDALATLDRAIRFEPLCEDLYRHAMATEASLGRRKEAFDRYARLRRLLETELNCDPDPETERLARNIERAQSREQVTSASS